MALHPVTRRSARAAARLLTPLAAGATLLAGAALGPTTASAAAGSRYVALGDSYSAGIGTHARVDSCFRSQLGYAPLVANASGWSLDYQACGHATTTDVLNNQVPALGADTGWTTVTAGGNDAGFTSVLTTCALPSWMSNCGAKLDYAQQQITGTIPGRLDLLYGAIRTKAPNARAVAVAYPHLFNGTDCNLLTFFSPDEQRRMNALTDQLDELTRSKAAAHQMGFVDPRGAFSGHAVCDASPWINGATLPVEESYHPNVAGNQAYAMVVAPALGGRAPQTVMAAGSPAGRTPTARDYALAAPGLASSANLRGARAAGLDASVIVRIDRDLRSGDLARARAAFGKLKQLDARVAARSGRR